MTEFAAMDADTQQKVRELTQTYLELQSAKDDLETEAESIKTQLKAILPPYDPAPEAPRAWNLDGIVTCWVKGRSSTKVDPAVLKKELVLAGVSSDILERAFSKATSSTTGAPYLRISKEE